MNKVLKFILTLSAVIYTTSCSEMITADFSDENAQITVKSEVELTKPDMRAQLLFLLSSLWTSTREATQSTTIP